MHNFWIKFEMEEVKDNRPRAIPPALALALPHALPLQEFLEQMCQSSLKLLQPQDPTPYTKVISHEFVRSLSMFPASKLCILIFTRDCFTNGWLQLFRWQCSCWLMLAYRKFMWHYFVRAPTINCHSIYAAIRWYLLAPVHSRDMLPTSWQGWTFSCNNQNWTSWLYLPLSLLFHNSP